MTNCFEIVDSRAGRVQRWSGARSLGHRRRKVITNYDRLEEIKRVTVFAKGTSRSIGRPTFNSQPNPRSCTSDRIQDSMEITCNHDGR